MQKYNISKKKINIFSQFTIAAIYTARPVKSKSNICYEVVLSIGVVIRYKVVRHLSKYSKYKQIELM